MGPALDGSAQAYHRWLERAWRGRLRLVTMLAVINEALDMWERATQSRATR